MLEARSLAKTFAAAPRPVVALADVSLSVAAGEFLAIVGRSGSGKSTLLAMLGGQSRPSSGTVLVDGKDIWRQNADAMADFRQCAVGFVFQFPSLLPSLRVVDNVALPGLLGRARDVTGVYRRAEELLYEIGLHDRAEAYPAELSDGQQRKVALARALINRPRLILADEPTGDLDEDSEREVFRLLIDLHERYGTTLVVVTHSQALAVQAERVVHLDNGRVVSSGVPVRSRALSTQYCPEEAPERIATPFDGPRRVALTLPGAGVRQFLSGFASWAALVLLAALTLNYATAFFQRRALGERQSARQLLEQQAMQQVRAEIQNLEYGPGGAYLLTLVVQPLDAEQKMYVTAPTARVFIQVDRSWQEVMAKARGSQDGRLLRLSGRQEFGFEFEPDVIHFEEQLAGYMHVRVTSAMMFSRSREPKEDLFERTDDYYVYLKPHYADDADIMRKNKWSAKPPLWIPMPAH